VLDATLAPHVNDADRRYLIPPEGLQVPQKWTVGRVTFYPGAGATSLVAESDMARGWPSTVREILDTAAQSSIAEVSGVDTAEGAIDAVQDAIDALRLTNGRPQWIWTARSPL
jgi:hypothetical protein